VREAIDEIRTLGAVVGRAAEAEALVAPVERALAAQEARAAEPRVRCVAGFSPVTELMALREFDGAKDRQRVERLDLVHVAPKLADRPIWVEIGNDDHRVGTDQAIAFTRALVREATAKKLPPQVELHVTTTPGHSTPIAAHDAAAAWIAGRARAVN
jgi:hypothetical protein